jgi:acetyltransferase EpsM
VTKLILIGAGGHSKVIQDIAAASQEYELYAIVADNIPETEVSNGIIRANTSFLTELGRPKLAEYKFCLAIGDNTARKQLFARLALPLEQYAVLIHPSAILSPSARIGYGTVVMSKAVINADTKVGNHCIINTGAVIEHDNDLGDYVHISPNATLSGTVGIGEGTHIGAGAVIIPGKKIGCWSIVGAGAVVTKDIESKVTVAGVPARTIKPLPSPFEE